MSHSGKQHFSLSLIAIVLPWVPSIFRSFVIVDMEPHFFLSFQMSSL